MVSYDIIERLDETYDIECVKNSEPILVPHEKPKCYKCRLYSLYICIVILVTCLILMIKNLNFKNNDYIDISARAWPHSCGICHKKLLCSDLKYGCCNISNFGIINSNETYFNEYYLDFNIVSMENINGSNCPSYKDLITKYNKYYLKYKNYDNGVKYCNSTIENCCKLDTIYDSLYRLENYGNNYSKIKDYYDHNKHQYIELNIKGKCPKAHDIIRRYNDGYTDPNKLILLLLYLLSFILCLFGWNSICSNNKRSR